MGTAKTVKRPPQQPAHPQYANYWVPLTPKRHIPPHPAQPQHTNNGAPRTRKRHQREHQPQRPTERSDPTQHAKGRTGDCPGPRKETTARRNVTRGGGGHKAQGHPLNRGSHLRRSCHGHGPGCVGAGGGGLQPPPPPIPRLVRGARPGPPEQCSRRNAAPGAAAPCHSPRGPSRARRAPPPVPPPPPPPGAVPRTAPSTGQDVPFGAPSARAPVPKCDAHHISTAGGQRTWTGAQRGPVGPLARGRAAGGGRMRGVPGPRTARGIARAARGMGRPAPVPSRRVPLPPGWRRDGGARAALRWRIVRGLGRPPPLPERERGAASPRLHRRGRRGAGHDEGAGGRPRPHPRVSGKGHVGLWQKGAARAPVRRRSIWGKAPAPVVRRDDRRCPDCGRAPSLRGRRVPRAVLGGRGTGRRALMRGPRARPVGAGPSHTPGAGPATQVAPHNPRSLRPPPHPNPVRAPMRPRAAPPKLAVAL